MNSCKSKVSKSINKCIPYGSIEIISTILNLFYPLSLEQIGKQGIIYYVINNASEELFEFELGTLEWMQLNIWKGKRAKARYVVNKVKNKKEKYHESFTYWLSSFE